MILVAWVTYCVVYEDVKPVTLSLELLGSFLDGLKGRQVELQEGYISIGDSLLDL